MAGEEPGVAGGEPGAAGGEPGAAGGPALRYEAARDELAEVVSRLEAGGATLEESLALWERGEVLADMCQRWLDGARERLAQAVEKSGDSVGGSS